MYDELEEMDVVSVALSCACNDVLMPRRQVPVLPAAESVSSAHVAAMHNSSNPRRGPRSTVTRPAKCVYL